MDKKTQATVFFYLRFILLNGESLYAGVFFITFFKTIRFCSDSFSYRICSCAHIRAVLSDEGYRNTKHSEQEGEIKIKSHAAVVAGKLYPDKKPRQQER